MAADGSTGRPASDQVAHIFTAFVQEVFRPLVSASGVSLEERRRLVDDFRQRLDLAEQVLDTEQAADPSAYAAPRSTVSSPAGPADSDADGSALDEIGRNQKSRVRELALLEVLSRETKAYSLQQLMAALAQRGFQDSQSAVVSQLHRLKKLGLIRQPGNSTGMYEITDSGLGHARGLRTSFGAYLPA